MCDKITQKDQVTVFLMATVNKIKLKFSNLHFKDVGSFNFILSMHA